MNTLKLSGIATLAALAGFATTAQAAFVFGSTGQTVDAAFYVAGASASRQVPPALAASDCDLAAPSATAGDPIVYNYQPGALSTRTDDYRITICTLKATLPGGATPLGTNNTATLGGKRVAIVSRAAGGTLFGVKPVAVEQKIQFINASTCPAADALPGVANIQQCTGLSGTNNYNGTADNVDLGLSDEDGLFTCNVALGSQCTAAEIAALSSANYHQFPLYQTIWTINLGKNFGKLNAGDAVITDLSPEVISGVFSGTIQSIQQIQKIMGLPVSAGATKGLKVCSRTDTSGTKAAAIQMYTGSAYCGASTPLGFVNAAAADANGYSVTNNSSAGTLVSCMDDGVWTQTIGINSLENSPITNVIDATISGVVPSQTTAAKGTYPWYMESTGQYNDTELNDAAITRSTIAQRKAFVDYYITQLQTPATLVAAGLNGEIGIPTIASPTDPLDLTAPVGWTSKFVGAGGNNCRLPQPGFPSYP